MQHVFAFGITLLPFVCLSVNSLHFILLLQNHLGKFNQVRLGYIFDRAVKKCVSSPLQLNKMATKAPHSLKIFEITAQMENSYNRHQISVTVYVIQLDFCQIFLGSDKHNCIRKVFNTKWLVIWVLCFRRWHQDILDTCV